MIKIFRKLSFFEGISFLLILFVTMPLKYVFNFPAANKIIGMLHGILFLAYVILAIILKAEKQWPIKKLLIVLVCSIIPFGTFWMDKKYFGDSK